MINIILNNNNSLSYWKRFKIGFYNKCLIWVPKITWSSVNSIAARVQAAYNRISFYTDLVKAVENADLVIAALPEVLDIKRDFYEKRQIMPVFSNG